MVTFSAVPNGKFESIVYPILLTAAMLGIALPLADGLRRMRKTPKPAGIDVRYAKVAGAVPQGVTLGYTSDLSDRDAGLRLFLEAQYAMAPHVLLEGNGRRYTLANMKDSAGPMIRGNSEPSPLGADTSRTKSPDTKGER